MNFNFRNGLFSQNFPARNSAKVSYSEDFQDYSSLYIYTVRKETVIAAQHTILI